MEQLDLNQIQTFVKLAQAGSFTKAAQILRQPKSRVSRRLAALEKELGVQLIYRTTRQFQLTETGRAFYEKAQGLIAGLEALSAEVSDTTTQIAGVIRITASDDMGVKYLPPILDEFSRLHPQIQFDVVLTQSYVDLVKESIDVALRIGHLKDSSLRAKKVGSLKNIFIASPVLMQRIRHSDHFMDIEKIPFVGLPSMKKIEVVRETDGKKMTFKTNMILKANNPALLFEFALLGKGMTFLPEFICEEHIRSGKLIQLFKNLKGQESPLNIVTPEQKEPAVRVKTFTEFLAKKMKAVLP